MNRPRRRRSLAVYEAKPLTLPRAPVPPDIYRAAVETTERVAREVLDERAARKATDDRSPQEPSR